ncbi:MAG: helix-turn-helix transcriptional regulator, partial [Xanthobacteraceae bacterium]
MAPHPRGSRWHPHSDGKVMQVRRLVEQTLHSYAEIAKRTGVSPASISRWASAGSWARPLFAP